MLKEINSIRRYKFLLLGTLLVLCTGLLAQRPIPQKLIRDTVFHKSGLTYYGQIVRYERFGDIRLRGPRGRYVQFENAHIDSIGWSETSRVKFYEELISLDSVATIDEVYLKDGSKLRGKIQEYHRGSYLMFKMASGVIRINEEDIERIIQEPKESLIALMVKREKPPKVYAFREQGFYSSVVFALLPGGGDYNSELGLSLQTSFGYQLNRQFGLGLGLSLDGYANVESDDTFVPLFAEARGYLWKKKNTPYWTVAAGYGFPLRTEAANQEIRRFEGGYMFHPAIGYRLGADKTINLTVDLGYKFQKAITEREFFFSGEIITRDVLYRRLSLRMSVIF